MFRLLQKYALLISVFLLVILLVTLFLYPDFDGSFSTAEYIGIGGGTSAGGYEVVGNTYKIVEFEVGQ